MVKAGAYDDLSSAKEYFEEETQPSDVEEKVVYSSRNMIKNKLNNTSQLEIVTRVGEVRELGSDVNKKKGE